MKLLFGLFVIGFAVAAPTSDYVVHEKRHNVKLTRSFSEVDKRSVLPMSISLKKRNLEHGYDHLMDVSHPDSPNYGKHWTVEKVAETFGPDKKSLEAVLEWLTASGIASERIAPSGGNFGVKVDLTVAEAESLLKTEYKVYDHARTGKPVLGCDEYSIPMHLQDHIEIIVPTVHAGPSRLGMKVKERSPEKKMKREMIKAAMEKREKPSPHYVMNKNFVPSKQSPEAVTPNDLSTCGTDIEPDCIRALYSLPLGTTSLSSMSVMEFDSTFKQADLNTFYSEFNGNTPPQGTAPVVVSVDGGEVGIASDDFGEAELDLMIAIPLVFPQPVQIYEVGDPIEGAGFGNFLDAINANFCAEDLPINTNEDAVYPDTHRGGFDGKDCGDITPASVISISWGEGEAGDTAYKLNQCNEYMMLGLLGVTVLFSSGDSGVGPASCTAFEPDYPAACPFVTSVGATTLGPAGSLTEPEVAVNGFGSGGGFSNIFPIPSYQAAAVNTFLTVHKPTFTAKQFNNSGAARGYPDVSANGQWLLTVIEGQEGEIGGTSMAAPIVGSVVNQINQARVAAGKSTVGFINPVLYANPSALNDVTSGFNNDISAGVASGCGTTGFEATTGWDPVTGLGTPNFAKLLPIFMALP